MLKLMRDAVERNAEQKKTKAWNKWKDAIWTKRIQNCNSSNTTLTCMNLKSPGGVFYIPCFLHHVMILEGKECPNLTQEIC